MINLLERQEDSIRAFRRSRASLCLFGASFETRNLGVAALGESVLQELCSRDGIERITVFDDFDGVSALKIARSPRHRDVVLERCGARFTRRFHRSESFHQIQLALKFKLPWNTAARRIRSANAILDISGGDSFTDLYGMWRFRAVTTPKLIAIQSGTPLVLLPQTYGPFRADETRAKAESIIRRCALAWARDARSFQMLRELAGPQFDPERHRQGVDVAFLLPAYPPRNPLPDPAREALAPDRSTPTIGLNVSGLLYNRPEQAREQYGLKADYREIIHRLVRRLTAELEATVLLVPHVLTPVGQFESDTAACQAVGREFDFDRVHIIPPVYDQSEMKWIIGRCDWFCGTRMHSTIAALSSGVPAAAIAYSVKTLGVFETVSQGVHVADPRELSTDEVVEQLVSSFVNRRAARAPLAAALPAVLQQAERQMDEVAAFIRTGRIEPSAGVRPTAVAEPAPALTS